MKSLGILLFNMTKQTFSILKYTNKIVEYHEFRVLYNYNFFYTKIIDYFCKNYFILLEASFLRKAVKNWVLNGYGFV